MIIEALLFALIMAFLFYEAVGISPGGVIAPGYLALSLNRPDALLTTLLLSVVVWGLLEILGRHLVLYGKRKLLLALFLGFALKLAIESWIQPLPGLPVSLETIGYLIPGLIANEMSRQRPLPTLAALCIVTVVVSLSLLLVAPGTLS